MRVAFPLPRPSDLGPVSSFVRSMPVTVALVGACPCCGQRGVFLFVPGNGPAGAANFFIVEPFPQDSARPPRRDR